MFTKLEALLTPIFGVFMAVSSCRHVWSLTQPPAPLPFQEGGGWGSKIQVSNDSFIFLTTHPHPGSHRHCLIRTKDVAITQKVPRDLRALHQEPGSKTKYLNKRLWQHSYNLRNNKGALCQELRIQMKHIFYNLTGCNSTLKTPLPRAGPRSCIQASIAGRSRKVTFSRKDAFCKLLMIQNFVFQDPFSHPGNECKVGDGMCSHSSLIQDRLTKYQFLMLLCIFAAFSLPVRTLLNQQQHLSRR